MEFIIREDALEYQGGAGIYAGIKGDRAWSSKNMKPITA